MRSIRTENSNNEENREQDLMLAEQAQELPAIIEEKKRKGTLRTGYTTGTSATAATKAALLALISGKAVDNIFVSLPKGGTANLKIAWTKIEGNGSSTSAVIKNAGDD